MNSRQTEDGMKALSIRAPWWWAILYEGKHIENRDWPTKFRGRVYIHASKWWNLGDVADGTAFVRDTYRAAGGEPCDTGLTYRDMRDLGGHLVGTVEIIDCVSQSDSPWFFGKYGFVLRDPQPLAVPIPCKGALGFFNPPLAHPQPE